MHVDALPLPDRRFTVVPRDLRNAASPSIRSIREIRQPDADRDALGPYEAPIARVAPGETVWISTADCFGDRLVSVRQVPSALLGANVRPCTGPIYIEGAEVGDTLVVTIEAIEATRDWAVSCPWSTSGGQNGSHATPDVRPRSPEGVRLYRRTPSGGFAWLDQREVPWVPVFGTIGTAPAVDVDAVATDRLGPRGGPMDLANATVGATLFLPVHHPGALFFVGDARVDHDQGKPGRPAIAIRAKGTFTFGLIKGAAAA